MAYRMPDGREVTTTPLAADDWKGVEPIYETMPGWSESTFGVKDRSGLPQAALNYIKRIEELTGVPIDIISTGPDRTETMILRDRSTRNSGTSGRYFACRANSVIHCCVG